MRNQVLNAEKSGKLVRRKEIKDVNNLTAQRIDFRLLGFLYKK